MLGFIFPRLGRLEADNAHLRTHAAGLALLLDEERHKLWEAKAEPARTLALMAAKDKEIATLKAEIRVLKRERDRAGRFAPCEK